MYLFFPEKKNPDKTNGLKKLKDLNFHFTCLLLNLSGK